MRNHHFTRIAALTATTLLLGGCATGAPLSTDFGVALRQELAAQVAYPEGADGSQPPADGRRAGLAQTRYQKGEVIQPTATASKVGVSADSAPPMSPAPPPR